MNFGQTIWDKFEMLLRTFLKTTWELGELQGNMMKRCWEHIRNKEEKQKITSPTSPPKGIKQGPS
jgi:hypothetical protein